MTNKTLKMRVAAALWIAWLSLVGCDRVPLEEKLVSADINVRAKGFEKLNKQSDQKKQLLVPKVINYLRNKDGRVANRAHNALVAIGVSSVESLITLVKDSDVYVRLNAASALGEIGTGAKTSIPTLLEALSDAHPLVREEALHSIGLIGTDSATAGPALILAATKDKNEDVRAMAKETLQKLKIEFKPSKKKKTS